MEENKMNPESLIPKIREILRKHPEGMTAKQLYDSTPVFSIIDARILHGLLMKMQKLDGDISLIKDEKHSKKAGIWKCKQKDKKTVAKPVEKEYLPEMVGDTNKKRNAGRKKFDEDMSLLLECCNSKEKLLVQIQKHLVECVLLIKDYFTEEK